jgi:beta-glucosidase-like glycosyl hydrolase
MKKVIYFVVAILSLLLCYFTCYNRNSIIDKAYSNKALLWADAQLEQMSLEACIGQLFIYTIAPRDSIRYRAKIKECIEKYHIGGLLFSEGTLNEHVILSNYAQTLSKIPTLITFDGEWGLAMRIKEAPLFPKNCALGCIQNNTLLYEYGKEVARQARLAGIHVNFAPVADVHTNPFNPVISYRSFGENPQNVAMKVAAYAQGLEDGGILSVSKHFPGHGDTQTDSHKTLPSLSFSSERLDSIELTPFKQIIKEKIGGIMVGHLLVNAIDKKRPTSLSNAAVQGLLKDKLGFRGLVFTDALAMSGVAGSSKACVEAIKAGNDLLLVPQNIQRAFQNVKQAIETGEIDLKSVRNRCRKILAFKYALGLLPRQQVNLTKAQQNINPSKTKALLTQLRHATFTALEKEEGSLTIDNNTTSLNILTLGGTNDSHCFIKELEKRGKKVKQYTSITPDLTQQLKEASTHQGTLIVTLTDKKLTNYRSILSALPKETKTIYVVFTDLTAMNTIAPQIPRLSGMLLAHSNEEETQTYAAKVLLRKATAEGRLSASMIGWFKEGEGIDLYSK